MTLFYFLIGIIFSLGLLENYFHQRNIKKIPIRVHVNGIRGKSSTVRLIAGGLRAAGYRVLAKTTGTAPRIILENGEEREIHRRGRANIIEQKHFIKEAVKRKVDAIVLECMAVHPELQWVTEQRMVHSTIGVITNIRQDHLDVYGSELSDVAHALKLTIPQNSHCITTEKRYFSILKNQADRLNTTLITVNPEKLPKNIIEKIPVFAFKDNVALALKTHQLLGILKEKALPGIIQAQPDPGALTVYSLKYKGHKIWLVNCFAANDRESLLIIWEKIRSILPEKLQKLPKFGLVNHRDDRINRTIQFDRMISQKLTFNQIILIGPTRQLSQKKLLQMGIPQNKIKLLSQEKSIQDFIDKLFQLIQEDILLFGLGNTRGLGQQIVQYFIEQGEKL